MLYSELLRAPTRKLTTVINTDHRSPLRYWLVPFQPNPFATPTTPPPTKMLLQPTAVVPWSASATDTPKLRSLLLYPQCYPTTTLHHHPSNTYALSLETAGLTQQQGAKPFTRFTVYGNNGSDTPSAPCCPYTDAAQHIVSLTTTPTLKGSAIPADAVEPVTEVLTQHGWSRSYSIPCTQFVVDADSIIQQHQQQHQQAVPQLAPGYSLDPHGLRHDDSELVDSLWTFRWGERERGPVCACVCGESVHRHTCVLDSLHETVACASTSCLHLCRTLTPQPRPET